MSRNPKPEMKEGPLAEPKPVIERVRTHAFEFSALQAIGGPALMCPRCGAPDLEYLTATTFDREPDGRSTHYVRVQHGISLPGSLPRAVPGDPAQRYHGIDVEFGCNGCVSVYDVWGKPDYNGMGHGIFLEIIHTQGFCSLSWVYDPLPESYADAQAAQEVSQKPPEAA